MTKYALLDANITAAYYLARSMPSERAVERIRTIMDSVRTKGHGPLPVRPQVLHRGEVLPPEPLRPTWMSSSRAAFRRLSLVEALE
jgi:hypothetical protein